MSASRDVYDAVQPFIDEALRRGAEMIGSVCGVFGPNGARCDIRCGHIGQHAGTDEKGVWRQW